MKRKLSIVLAVIAILSTISIDEIKAFAAEEKTNSTVFFKADLSNPRSYEKNLNALFIDPSVEEIVVLNNSYFNESISKEAIYEDSSVPSIARSTSGTIYRYRITNVNNAGNYTGATNIAVAVGTPGMTLTITKTNTVSNTYSINQSVVWVMGGPIMVREVLHE